MHSCDFGYELLLLDRDCAYAGAKRAICAIFKQNFHCIHKVVAACIMQRSLAFLCSCTSWDDGWRQKLYRLPSFGSSQVIQRQLTSSYTQFGYITLPCAVEYLPTVCTREHLTITDIFEAGLRTFGLTSCCWRTRGAECTNLVTEHNRIRIPLEIMHYTFNIAIACEVV